jgi:16S rRNA (guanine527-N7)-methyltransferase
MTAQNQLITKYFPDLTALQKQQFEMLESLYKEWNSQINVISRKDIDMLYERHVLHSLGIAKIIQFRAGTKIMDVGTGGGFPGIPLAIMFPESKFLLVDSVGKKIKVVNEISAALGLKNLVAEKIRVEEVKEKFHFIVSRAVTDFPLFYEWVKHKILPDRFNKLKNGILYLKGGDLEAELKSFKKWITVYELKDYFKEEFFETKKVVYMAL